MKLNAFPMHPSATINEIYTHCSSINSKMRAGADDGDKKDTV